MEYEVIYKMNRPYGIRNSGGYVVFFPRVRKWEGQEQRYQEEIMEQMMLANRLCDYLNILSHVRKEVSDGKVDEG